MSHIVFKIKFIFFKLKLVPEINRTNPNARIIIVGTKVDLRNDSKNLEILNKNKLNPIDVKQGNDLARQLKAVRYMECSALNKVNFLNWN